VLIDDNDIPVKVENVEDFLSDVLDIYFTASNEYLTAYEKIRSQRKVSGLVEYEE
jgi:hypothetical protein